MQTVKILGGGTKRILNFQPNQQHDEMCLVILKNIESEILRSTVMASIEDLSCKINDEDESRRRQSIMKYSMDDLLNLIIDQAHSCKYNKEKALDFFTRVANSQNVVYYIEQNYYLLKN